MNYPRRTIQRARRAIACSPFCKTLFATMALQSVGLAEVAGASGVAHRYTRKPVSEGAAERSLLWLIQVGLLRREVDGQGLTDSFRLTPLGRLSIEQWQQQGETFRRVTWGDRLQDFFHRLLGGAV
ncbi:Npun_F0494 family protein [Altericista sp. CCNU0014]|uniref:Npun_F0494 family protein n=1 Tax=Altericista sp. CCNU0014 TaxID=3082949 RepID=UPI00384AD4BD